MAILSRGETVDTTNPKLVFYGVTRGPADFRAGRLTDVVDLEFAVYDVSDAAKRIEPLEILARGPLNLVTDRLGLGRYAANFSMASNSSQGRHEIRYYYTENTGDPERTEREYFDVVDSISPTVATPNYCSPSDLKDEGVCGKTDAYLLGRIELASRFIEKVTGRFFEPRFLELNVDGLGSAILPFSMPIIGVEEIAYETSPYQPSSEQVDDEFFRVYSRHLSQGLTQPDDRNDPRIELFRYSDEIITGTPYALSGRLIFPLGQQNIIVKGVFGYTDANGRSAGGTPVPICHVCKLLVMRELSQMASLAARDDAFKRFRIKSEKTKDQSYTLDSLAASGRLGKFTGDPDIDTLLAGYIRPPAMRGV
jgi:hypothetical protein